LSLAEQYLDDKLEFLIDQASDFKIVDEEGKGVLCYCIKYKPHLFEQLINHFSNNHTPVSISDWMHASPGIERLAYEFNPTHFDVNTDYISRLPQATRQKIADVEIDLQILLLWSGIKWDQIKTMPVKQGSVVKKIDASGNEYWTPPEYWTKEGKHKEIQNKEAQDKKENDQGLYGGFTTVMQVIHKRGWWKGMQKAGSEEHAKELNDITFKLKVALYFSKTQVGDIYDPTPEDPYDHSHAISLVHDLAESSTKCFGGWKGNLQQRYEMHLRELGCKAGWEDKIYARLTELRGQLIRDWSRHKDQINTVGLGQEVHLAEDIAYTKRKAWGIHGASDAPDVYQILRRYRGARLLEKCEADFNAKYSAENIINVISDLLAAKDNREMLTEEVIKWMHSNLKGSWRKEFFQKKLAALRPRIFEVVETELNTKQAMETSTLDARVKKAWEILRDMLAKEENEQDVGIVLNFFEERMCSILKSTSSLARKCAEIENCLRDVVQKNRDDYFTGELHDEESFALKRHYIRDLLVRMNILQKKPHRYWTWHENVINMRNI